MSREQSYTAFVLKKNDYGETDQIVTLFTKEQGKLRCLVKAAKLSTSKLQPALQPLFIVGVTLAGNSNLPKVIRTQVIKTHSEFYSNAEKLQCWYLVSELLLKSLGDGSPNEPLFNLVSDYVNFLDKNNLSQEQISLSTVQFQIKALNTLGLGIKFNEDVNEWFSLSQGGFGNKDISVDAIQISADDSELFRKLAEQGFKAILEKNQNSTVLHRLVNNFMTYQLERELKASQYIKP